MFKLVKLLLVLGLIGAAFYVGSVYADKQDLQDKVLRLHVVGASDSAADQEIKLKVRDAVLEELEVILEQSTSKEDAQQKIESELNRLEEAANQMLHECGVSDVAAVTLDREKFDTRVYDTFVLPAGVYDSLRVTIGDGEGKNWWCVVFPRLCVSAASEQVEDAATGAGFSHGLSGAITGKKQYRVRFFLIDCLGKLENIFT